MLKPRFEITAPSSGFPSYQNAIAKPCEGTPLSSLRKLHVTERFREAAKSVWGSTEKPPDLSVPGWKATLDPWFRTMGLNLASVRQLQRIIYPRR